MKSTGTEAKWQLKTDGCASGPCSTSFMALELAWRNLSRVDEGSIRDPPHADRNRCFRVRVGVANIVTVSVGRDIFEI